MKAKEEIQSLLEATREERGNIGLLSKATPAEQRRLAYLDGSHHALRHAVENKVDYLKGLAAGLEFVQVKEN